MQVTEISKIETIQSLIYEIRGVKVILDFDLAKLYGVETKRLKEAVKRNYTRFEGSDFMFDIAESEYNLLNTSMWSQIATTSVFKRPKSYGISAFTELGVAMLSSVLRSSTAIEINRNIMRAFVEMRHIISDNTQIFKRIETIEYNQLDMQQHIANTDKRIEQVFKLMEQNNSTPSQGIFYAGQIFDAYAFASNLIKSAHDSIILIDNYIDETILTLLGKRQPSVKATIHTHTISKQLQLDLEKYNKQYEPIIIKEFKDSHDRFLIIDNDVYHIGASLKDLGKKLFAFSKMNISKELSNLLLTLQG